MSLPVNPFLSCLLFLFLCAGSQSRHTNFYLWHASAELRASLVAQMVKILPAVQKTWVRSLGWEDPLQKGTATRSSILAWRIPWTVACQGFCLWDSLGKSTGVGCHFLLQGIFPTQESNPGLLHCRQILYQLSQIFIIPWYPVVLKNQKGRAPK